MTKPILLITGATGNQGGATIDELLRRPSRWDVRALVRNPQAPKAAALATRGVTLVRGDLNDADSLRVALAGVHGVLSVQTPMGQGPEGEERQGKLLATLAAEAGGKHFVYCSAGGVDRHSGVPHFENKRAIFLATYEQWVAAEWESIRTELAGRRSGSLARVVRLVLDHHRRWATFRCSLRALAATDRVVRAFRIEQREAQLKLMEEMLAGGRRGPSRARCLVALLTFERVCDAVADGETEALSIPEAAIVRDLKTELEALFPTP